MQGHRTASLFVLTFRFPVDTSLFRPTPLAGGMAMVFADDLFRPLRPGLRFFFFFFTVQRCGSGFWGPASSAHVIPRAVRASTISPPNSAYTVHQSGLVLWYCFG